MKVLHCVLLCCLVIPVYTSAQVIYENDHIDVIRLQDNMFLLKENYQFSANCLAITGENGILLLDTGFGEIDDDFLDAVGSLGREVKVIVNSHAHHDHFGANAVFGKDVTVIGHRSCRDELARTGQQVQTFESSHTFDFEGHLVFCMAYTGGHSSCDVITFIPDLNIAFLGDLYFSESFPLVLPEEGSTVETLVNHLNEIYQSLPEETILFPGHGKETTMEYFGGYIAILEETIEVVRKRQKSGKSLKEIQDADVLKKWEKWGKSIPFITKESWIAQIYESYSK
jgi:glyoxylase-like metal-dependent hydrolase (beta-lactamase superfamily II)